MGPGRSFVLRYQITRAHVFDASHLVLLQPREGPIPTVFQVYLQSDVKFRLMSLHDRLLTWTRRPDKYIQTAEQGMVIMGVTEQEAGRYDCRLGPDTLCSYNITVDTQRCAAPSKSHDYQKVYSDWCHEFEKYKMAMKTWERRQLVSVSTANTWNPHGNMRT